MHKIKCLVILFSHETICKASVKKKRVNKNSRYL